MKYLFTIFLGFGTIFCLGQNYIIKDVDIIPISEKGILKKQSVLIENGVIIKIGKFKDVKQSNNAQIIKAKGKFLMPSLSDMHVHLREDSLVEQQLFSYLAAGVTHLRIMNNKADQLKIMKAVKSKAYRRAPNIFFSKVVRRADIYNESQADSLITKVKADGLDFIKIIGLSNENTFVNIMKSAQKHNVIVCGHYPAYLQFGKGKLINTDTLFKSKFKSIEHLGEFASQPDDKHEELIDLTKKNNVYICPTLDWEIMAYNLQFPEQYKNRMTYNLLPKTMISSWEKGYSEAIEKAGGKGKVIESRNQNLPNFDKKSKLLKAMYEKDCLLLIGGDAGNFFQAEGFNVYEEMVNWSNVGIDNYTILKSGTHNAAKFFNQEKDWGTVTVGAKAELILLEKNPLIDIKNISTIIHTISNGVLYDNKKMMLEIK